MQMFPSKLSEAKFFHAKVTLLSQYDRIVTQIKEKLTESQANLFKKSCFGCLVYEAPDLKFAPQLCHQILLREADCESIRTDAMWFNLFGTSARFGPEEFSVITGLGLGDFKASMSELSSKGDEPRILSVFKPKGKLTYAGVLDCFKAKKVGEDVAVADQDVADKEMVSIALLAFLLGALIPREGKTFVDTCFLHLSEDVEAWNKFPWGSLCYSKTAESLQRAVPKGLLQKDKEWRTYSLGGFPYAFQVIHHSFNVWLISTIGHH